MTVCKRCGDYIGTGLYCKECTKAVRREMRESGYLTPIPRPTPRSKDRPGPRACSEGSGSWDNAVRAVEGDGGSSDGGGG